MGWLSGDVGLRDDLLTGEVAPLGGKSLWFARRAVGLLGEMSMAGD